eukprot:UN24323
MPYQTSSYDFQAYFYSPVCSFFHMIRRKACIRTNKHTVFLPLQGLSFFDH